MAPPDDGVQPDGVTPPATQLLDQRIDAVLERRAAVDQNTVLGGTGGGGNGPFEARIAKVEASLESVDKTLTEIKHEIRTLRENARADFRLVFAAIIAVTLGLAGLMAKGFHWL